MARRCHGPRPATRSRQNRGACLAPASDLDRSFLRPESPEALGHAYLQAWQVVEMIEAAHGSDVMGDVTGHGFYSGLFVAMAKSCLHTQVDIDFEPRCVMQAMRRTLALSIQRRLLMSCCYVLLDPRSKQLLFSNAGHPYPYHYSKRTGRLKSLPSRSQSAWIW